MTEVRSLGADDSIPEGAAWVLIEKAEGRFKVTGQAAGADKPVFFAGSSFETAEEAIKTLAAWADLLGVGVLYVRGLGDAEAG